jgi:hypothetical protein
MQKPNYCISKDRDLKLTEHRVLRYLESVLGYENALPISQKNVSEELGYSAQAISKTFSVLIRKGLLERIEISPLRPTYRLNPKFCWRGKHTKWIVARKAAPPLAFTKLVTA